LTKNVLFFIDNIHYTYFVSQDSLYFFIYNSSSILLPQEIKLNNLTKKPK